MAMIQPAARESKAPAKAIPNARPAYPKLEREAAARLGAVYLELARMRETPFGRWAVIPEKGYGDTYRPFYTVLGMVYGTDTERERKYGRANYQSRVARYKKDCETVMPLVVESTLQFAIVGLNAEVAALRKLYERITSEPGIGERLHKASEEIVAAFRREMRKEEAARAGLPPPPDVENQDTQTGSYISYLSPGDVKKIVREKVAKMVPYAGDDVLSILFEHPDGMKILGAYAVSAERGTVASATRVLDAINAVLQFSQTAVNKRGAIRYPFFVIGGVARMRLDDVPGFKEFAVNFCQAMTRDGTETALMFAGAAVGILAMIIAGPSVIQLVAAVLFAGTDLAFAGWNVSLAFVREREQDFANRASRFKGEANQWATPIVYQDTILAGTAALLSGIAFFGSGKELRALLKAPARPTAGAVAAPKAAAASEGNRLAATENKAIQSRPVDTARRASDRLAENRLVTRQPRDEVYTASPKSKEEETRRIAQEVERDRAARFQKQVTEGEGQTPRRATEKPDPTAEQQRSTRRGLESPAPPPKKERVPLRKFLDSERRNIEEQILDIQAEIERETTARELARLKKDAAARKRNFAVRDRKSAATIDKLQTEFKRLLDEYNGFYIPGLAEKKLALQALRSRNTTEYFEALSAAASKKKGYVSVGVDSLDDVFLPFEGELSRDHVRPRSVVFGKSGFLDKIIWEQQIFLFNLRKNLKVAPAVFNSARGVIPYSKLESRLSSKYIKSDRLSELIRLEAEVDRDIERLLADPRNAELWRSFGYTGPFK